MTAPLGRWILLVEDNQFDLRDLQRKIALCRWQATVIVAKDGQYAIEMLDPNSASRLPELPDVVMLDLEMPRLGGLEVLAFIRRTEATHHLPVIMMTTSNCPRDRARASQLAADEYLVKGATAQEICATISRHLARAPGPSIDC